jgi:hypothetical protein
MITREKIIKALDQTYSNDVADSVMDLIEHERERLIEQERERYQSLVDAAAKLPRLWGMGELDITANTERARTVIEDISKNVQHFLPPPKLSDELDKFLDYTKDRKVIMEATQLRNFVCMARELEENQDD